MSENVTSTNKRPFLESILFVPQDSDSLYYSNVSLLNILKIRFSQQFMKHYCCRSNFCKYCFHMIIKYEVNDTFRTLEAKP